MMIVKNRRGISTFIATLLLMVLAVAAGVVIYAYTMGYLGGFGGPQTMGAIALDTSTLDTTNEAPNWDYPPVALTAYIRNIGKTSFDVSAVYVNGIRIANSIALADGGPVSGWAFSGITPEGSVGILTIQMKPETSGAPAMSPITKDLSYQALTSTQGGAPVYGFLPSITYTVKIIGKDNTQISFEIKK